MGRRREDKNLRLKLGLAPVLAAVIFIGLFGRAGLAGAQTDSLILSITPPLIKNNISPGETWQSTIKVVNNNAAAMDIYVEAVDFTSGEESGTVRFLPAPAGGDAGSPYLLSQWLAIEAGPYNIPAYASREIPFRVAVPAEAGPGGHYAAILAGTRPPAAALGGSGIKVSSLLASLLLLTVKGEIIEQGQIREFSADKSIYGEPSVTFTVRFSNTGNVHIQPRGEIRVFDLWNREKGRITINHNSDFGNVLPGQIRRWQFAWQKEKSLLDMGRYRAELLLSYGEETKETVHQTLYFWLVYLKPLLVIISSLAALVFILVWLIRRYIRRAIINTQAQSGIVIPGPGGTRQKISVIPPAVKKGAETIVTDIKTRQTETGLGRQRKKLSVYFKLALIGLITAVLVGVYFYYRSDKNYLPAEYTADAGPGLAVTAVSDSGQGVLVVEEGGGSNQDDLAIVEINTAPGPGTAGLNEANEATGTVASRDETGEGKTATATVLTIKVLNGSGFTGAAALAAKRLAGAGFPAAVTGNADRFDYPNTIIRYQPDAEEAAVKISGFFPAPVELADAPDQTEDIIIIIGRNYK
ncbi:MAG: LytR C-terminal domain-containing protein [Planctomycetes bacterium]|jgi:hypothetical protein|nr:LytR C-terminal domain-containing protein [Planctomycetota bacterium]